MARMEILTGRERRRVWPDEKKLAILAEVAESGLSVSEVARRHDVIPQQIYAWRRKFTQEAEAFAPADRTTFLPVTVVARAKPDQPDGKEEKGQFSSRRAASVEIRCKGGRVLKVAAGLDPALLQTLIRTVEAA